MTDAPKHKSLYAALAAAQAEMGRALKDSTNPHFRSKYADLASVMAACMPALTKHGIAVMQPPYDDETGRYIKTVFVHGETGESVEARTPLIVSKNDMQGYGSACTYARRYGLLGMAMIAPDDDDGNAATSAPPDIEAPQAPARPDIDEAKASLFKATDMDDLKAVWSSLPKQVQQAQGVIDAKDARKAELALTLPDDTIPYQ